jgi:hypothetical protein
MLAIARTPILGSESKGTHDHTLLSNVSRSPQTLPHYSPTADFNQWPTFQSSAVYSCWSSPAQWFFVPSPTGFITIYYSLTAIGAFGPLSNFLSFHYVFIIWCDSYRIGNTQSKISSIFAYILFAAYTCWPSHCLENLKGRHIRTENKVVS